MTAARLHAAVETSRRWYESIFSLHGIPVQSDDRLWVALRDFDPLAAGYSPVGSQRVWAR